MSAPPDDLRVGPYALETLRYTRLRGGPPILLVHGITPISPEAPFLDPLAELGEVVAPSHPGFGSSPRPPDFDTMYDLVHLYRAVLDALARALRLDETERAHLFDLVQARPADRRAQRVSPATYQLLETLDEVASPALLLGRRMDVLACNQAARALMADFPAMPARQRNYARFVFLDEYARALHPDWSAVASFLG